MTPREYFGRRVASDLRRADLAGKTFRALTGPDDSFPIIVDGPESVIALPSPRMIPETVRGLVRRHGRRG